MVPPEAVWYQVLFLAFIVNPFGLEHYNAITVIYKHFESPCFVHEAQVPGEGKGALTQDCHWEEQAVTSHYLILSLFSVSLMSSHRTAVH